MEFIFLKSHYSLNQGCYEKTTAMWSLMSDTVLSIIMFYVVDISRILMKLLLRIHKWLRWVIISFIQWLILIIYISTKKSENIWR